MHTNLDLTNCSYKQKFFIRGFFVSGVHCISCDRHIQDLVYTAAVV